MAQHLDEELLIWCKTDCMTADRKAEADIAGPTLRDMLDHHKANGEARRAEAGRQAFDQFCNCGGQRIEAHMQQVLFITTIHTALIRILLSLSPTFPLSENRH